MYSPPKCAKRQISAPPCPIEAMFQFARPVHRVKYLEIYGLYKFHETTQAQIKPQGIYKSFLLQVNENNTCVLIIYSRPTQGRNVQSPC